jgi:hypothetical protein
MADYYPPIAQAVKGLERNTAEARRAIYDLARSAMLTQLRSVTPALSEPAIHREQLALEAAIRKAEMESLRPPRTPHRASIRQSEKLPPPNREHGGQQAEAGAGVAVAKYPGPPLRPHDIRAGAAVVQRSLAKEKKVVAVTWLVRHRRRVAALTTIGFVAFPIAVVGVLKGPAIVPALLSISEVEGTTGSIAPENSGTLPKIADRVGSFPSAQPSSNGDASVAPKVMLYEEDSVDPAGRRFGGSAAWHTDKVSTSPGGEPEVAIRADIEIPERGIGVRWSLRHNDDAAMPASHTIEIIFTLPADFPHGGISGIPGLMMKQSESSHGVPLAGLGVKVANNLFLITLSTADADMQRNVQLLKERSWFDIPVVYDDGKRAIVAVEKGPPGERAFSDAFAAWEP